MKPEGRPSEPPQRPRVTKTTPSLHTVLYQMTHDVSYVERNYAKLVKESTK
jgi:hypothetical protein